ncbi:helix-turn-helix domain-containing protein [Actinorugispora endophytica]|uniref:Helix-turn-helix protein n=1 Tax=Actinorugispora endophytica TaxID=1605990 RepID=A0A4R6UJM5_9ACTN|nr:helix-turn-helix transcriptional regulator [Actinorugispora endophytica]TDQ46316.1 helix-turn-helix protein [Actinorugispora endophytica]
MTPDRIREQLRQARRASGLVWVRFSAGAGYAESYLRNVENGNRALTADVVAAYDEVLGTGGRFTRLLQDCRNSAGWELPQNLALLGGLADGRGRMLRRDFIAATAALTVSVTSWARACLQMSCPHQE